LFGVEVLSSPGDGEIQATSRWEHPVARIEPDRPCLVGVLP
jgi:hypothetical protein